MFQAEGAASAKALRLGPWRTAGVRAPVSWSNKPGEPGLWGHVSLLNRRACFRHVVPCFHFTSSPSLTLLAGMPQLWPQEALGEWLPELCLSFLICQRDRIRSLTHGRGEGAPIEFTAAISEHLWTTRSARPQGMTQ